MNKFEVFLAGLNNRFVSRLGAALFVPALTALCDQNLAKAFLQQFAFFKRLPDIDVTIASAIVVALAGFLLYQGKPEKTGGADVK